ncbi:uncharacterized protein LOC111025227 [Momordica charantia]|uniref:Uncharacterized protein LOC111025227 n=1 Tax=Momordica charantia TaxID=3673 RepID=A0A6J1DY23_MOMCH|nr:uncharacterized protein LOC111025227 [Momordica charantia]
MCGGRAKVTYAKLAAKVFELGVVKLLPIVCHNGLRYTKATYDICPYEGRDSGFRYVGERLGLGPLCEVIHSNHSELGLALAQRERTNDIYPPLREWPRGRDGGEQLGRLVDYGSVALAIVASSNELLGVLAEGRPIVSLSDHFG